MKYPDTPLKVAIRDELDDYLSMREVELSEDEKHQVADLMIDDDYVWDVFNQALAEHVDNILNKKR